MDKMRKKVGIFLDQNSKKPTDRNFSKFKNKRKSRPQWLTQEIVTDKG
jgi:hypothetical protein